MKDILFDTLYSVCFALIGICPRHAFAFDVQFNMCVLMLNDKLYITIISACCTIQSYVSIKMVRSSINADYMSAQSMH